ncbi:MAG TPA: hypothetical protein VKK61_05485, partial [Tepidisphaeraceae bacterium]|nr:hypothetical protein [Tepidisphaeraceae bacterium]
VADARQDAVQHVMESIRPVELAPGETVGDLLAHEKAHQEIYRWLDSRPVTDVQFKDNLQVELIVSTPSDDLADVVINSGQSVGTTLPTDPQRMEIVKREFARRIAIAIGRATVKPINEKISTTRPAAIVLPQQPPAWIGQLIESEAVAQPKASKLRTKNAAEIKASEILRDRIDSLKLTPTLSIGEAAAHDPQVTEAIDRAMMRARVFKVDYRADDSVMVRMMIDSRDLWYELCQIGNQ